MTTNQNQIEEEELVIDLLTHGLSPLRDHIPPSLTLSKFLTCIKFIYQIVPETEHLLLDALKQIIEYKMKIVKSIDQRVLDYRLKVSSSRYIYAFTEKIPMNVLPSIINDLSEEQREAVQVLDLSFNGLLAEDIPFMVECMNALKGRNIAVILRNNKLYNCWGNEGSNCDLRNLLNHPNVSWVDVTINPVALMEIADFLPILTKEERSKLIILLPMHVQNHVLKSLSKGNESLMEELSNTYKSYYTSDVYKLIREK